MSMKNLLKMWIFYWGILFILLKLCVEFDVYKEQQLLNWCFQVDSTF